jgi:hypothetical protein
VSPCFIYRVLVNNSKKIQEIERKKRVEEAIVNRKRSSRLAIKENEKEVARLAAVKEAEEREQRSRALRLEARQRKEESERIKKKNDREQRMKERQEREMRMQAEKEAKLQQAAPETNAVMVDTNSAKRSYTTPTDGGRLGVSPPQRELSCEICHTRALGQVSAIHF